MVKFLDEHKILLETLVPSDWTWGCELEGFISESDYDSAVGGSIHYDEYDEESYPDYDDLTKYFDDLIAEYCHNCVTSNGDAHSDGSLHPSSGELAFEYSTPVFKTLPSEYDGFISFLEGILDDGFYTTSACGFHHHLMYNGMNERDCIWIYCNLAMDTDFIEFTKNFDDFSLYHGHWASDNELNQIKKYITENNWGNVLDLLSTEKYRLFRIHPQGTLEWRGPRDFLNDGVIEIIKKFYYKHLPIIINKFIEYNRSNTLFNTDITKEQFFNNLKEAQNNKGSYYKELLGNNEFIQNTEGIYKNKNKNPNLERKMDPSEYDNIWKKIKDKPIALVKLVKGDNPILYILFKSGNLKYNFLREILSNLNSDNLLGLTHKEFSNKLIEIFINSGHSLDELLSPRTNLGSIVFEYLDYSVDKETIIHLIKNTTGEQCRILYFKMLNDNLVNIREAEEILYENVDDIIPLIREDDLHKVNFNSTDIVKFCFFLLKLCYQYNYQNVSLFKNMREIIIENADTSFQSKWNNMAIGITINKNIRYSALIISLKPEEYIRLRAEFPSIDHFLSDDIKNSLPSDISKINML